MLSNLSGGSSLPRQVIQWFDTLDLSYAVRNIKMDLSNGFLIAEILTRKYPSEISILTFYNAQKKQKKIDNWQQIQKCKNIHQQSVKDCFFLPLQVIFQSLLERNSKSLNSPQTAQSFIFRFYQFLTGLKLNTDRRLASTLPAPEEPLYKKPTASYIAKDRELHRVVDDLQKEFRTKALLTQQQNMIHTQKYNTGLIQWLIDKRKQQIEKQVNKQKQQIQKRTKSFVNTQSKVEVREIELKCFNSSTSKKVKGQFGQFNQNKGVLDFLAESASLLLKKDTISNDLKKFGIEIKEKDNSGINLIFEIFNRCDEEDSKGNYKITADTLNRIVELFKKTSQINLIIENIHNQFLDFKKFFSLFLKPLKIYDRQSQTYKLIVSLISQIAKGLHKYDSESSEMMFEQIFLPDLLKIAQNEYKRSGIANLCLQFVRKQSECYYGLVQRVKQIYTNDLKSYIALLAHFLQKISRDCEDIQYTLWSQFFYYGFLGLSNPSPSVRVNGAKILSRLFSDVVVANNQIVSQKLNTLKNLVEDPWWEVKAQAIIIFKSILLSKYKNQTGSQDINEDLNTKTILHYIRQVFKPDISHNILRIGLIELAELINYQESLCDRYLQILLHVGAQIRNDILNTNIIKFGPVVYGANTFNYKLTGAPLVWNSLGIAKVLSQFIKKNNITSLNHAHLEILYSTISKNGNFIQNYQQWLKIYEDFKEKIFKTLLDEQLCVLGSNIIKQFLQIKEIHGQIISASRQEISRLLSNTYIDSSEGQTKNNLLQFFKYLNKEESEYTYKLIKDFAEREKTKYLSSNLVDFMNDLTRERRKRLFNE